MVLTVTLNPAVDYTVYGERFLPYRTNRCEALFPDAGGKGNNTARIARLLGADVIATGFIGGFTGQFIIEQLAGDLLPNPTLRQTVATGFNRNHRLNNEGGILPEEWIVEYVCDRAETAATIFMGLTWGCSRCHDHKYDPITQRDYYQLFAFFNNIAEQGSTRGTNAPPSVEVPALGHFDEYEKLLARRQRGRGVAGK